MSPGKDTKELCLHSTAYIPYSFYECHLPTSFLTVPMHWHSEFELDYVVRGSGEFLCGGEHLRAKEGEVLLVLPNRLHGASPGGPGELLYYALVFSPAMLGAGQQGLLLPPKRRCRKSRPAAATATCPISTGNSRSSWDAPPPVPHAGRATK